VTALSDAFSPPESDPADPARLLDAARGGDRDALAELFARYAPRVQRIAFRLTRSADDADDVLQEVFVHLPEAAAGFQGRGSFESWIGAVAARRALSLLRKRRRLADGEIADSIASALDDHELRVDLAAALERLPASLRAVLVLREEGYGHGEIAALLGISRSASEVRLFRARERLRAMIGGQP